MIDEKIISLCEKKLKKQFNLIEEIALYNQEKVLKCFQKNRIALRHFAGSSGYGYGDEGRDTLNQLFADVFRCESGICSPNIVSGTHALSLALYGVLKRGDLCLSITGEPYDTLSEVIHGKDNGSLEDYGVCFKSIELKNDKIDKTQIRKFIKKQMPTAIYMQRSRGYAWRSALSINEIENAINFVKSLGFNGVVILDNCYGEFLDKREPTEVGVNVMAGSLIKNPGGGVAPTGGYIVGDKKYVDKILCRMTAPSIAGEVGSYLPGYQYYYQGIFLAPHSVSQAVKGAMLFSAVLSELGYETLPKLNQTPNDIITSIKFNDKDKLIKFIQGIQKNSPIDSYVDLMPWDMPGYADPVIMAAGCFVQGSSLELSADAPVKPPYIAYMQGGLTYEHCKIALKNVEI